MSQEYIELRGSSVVELRRVDRILSELARPTLNDESISPSTRAAMVQVGIVVSGRASRKDLIERLWGRKRTLLRQVGSLGDWGPMQPVA
jgi:siroheme synthase (precorrin-2 oxidase/ferrochelatase)